MIAIDLRGTQGGNAGVHGGGEYIRSVLAHIHERGLQARFLGVVDAGRPENIYVQCAQDYGFSLLRISADEELGAALRQQKVATFYSPLPYDMRNRPEGVRTVVTIHGLRSLELPTDSLEWRYAPLKRLPIVAAKRLLLSRYRRLRQSQLQEIANFADTIIAPSEHTKFSLLGFLQGLSEEKIQVCYSPATAVSAVAMPDDSVLSEHGLASKSFVLLVSGGRFEKNIIRALDSIQLLRKGGSWPSGLKVVVTGGKPRRMKREHRGAAQFLPYLSTEKLAALYKHSRLLIYPTLNEGFGYPPLESLTYGTPVVASGLCSLPEVSGDCIGYFDPRNPYDMAARILQALHSFGGAASHEALQRVQAVRARQAADLDKLIEILCG